MQIIKVPKAILREGAFPCIIYSIKTVQRIPVLLKVKNIGIFTFLTENKPNITVIMFRAPNVSPAYNFPKVSESVVILNPSGSDHENAL